MRKEKNQAYDFQKFKTIRSFGREIYSSILVRSAFLDLSKAFDKVWHKGLLYKLKSMGVSGDLFNLFKKYLSGRLQRVILNGQTSLWRPVLAGVL